MIPSTDFPFLSLNQSACPNALKAILILHLTRNLRFSMTDKLILLDFIATWLYRTELSRDSHQKPILRGSHCSNKNQSKTHIGEKQWVKMLSQFKLQLLCFPSGSLTTCWERSDDEILLIMGDSDALPGSRLCSGLALIVSAIWKSQWIEVSVVCLCLFLCLSVCTTMPFK